MDSVINIVAKTKNMAHESEPPLEVDVSLAGVGGTAAPIEVEVAVPLEVEVVEKQRIPLPPASGGLIGSDVQCYAHKEVLVVEAKEIDVTGDGTHIGTPDIDAGLVVNTMELESKVG